MDDDNFKSKVAHFQGSDGSAYVHALHEVWSVMYRLQKEMFVTIPPGFVVVDNWPAVGMAVALAFRAS